MEGDASPFVVDRSQLEAHDEMEGSRDMLERMPEQLNQNHLLFTQVMMEMLRYLEKLNGRDNPKKRKRDSDNKKKPHRDRLLLEDEEILVFRYELVFISTFLMTHKGLESVYMVDFNKSWVIIINTYELSTTLAKLMKKGEILSHFERRRKNKNGSKALRTFSKPNIVEILKRNMTPLGLYNYKDAVANRWPNVKSEHIVIFNGEEWLSRWQGLMHTNIQDVKHWRSDLSTWKIDQRPLSEQEKRGWLTCRTFIPHGLYQEEEEDEVEDVQIQTPLTIDFGWCVSLLE